MIEAVGGISGKFDVLLLVFSDWDMGSPMDKLVNIDPTPRPDSRYTPMHQYICCL